MIILIVSIEATKTTAVIRQSTSIFGLLTWLLRQSGSNQAVIKQQSGRNQAEISFF
jgi:hypothetical protein